MPRGVEVQFHIFSTILLDSFRIPSLYPWISTYSTRWIGSSLGARACSKTVEKKNVSRQVSSLRRGVSSRPSLFWDVAYRRSGPIFNAQAGGTQERSRLRHRTTSQKVAGSIPDEAWRLWGRFNP